MYLDFFGLSVDPFALSPNLNLLFLSHSHEETMAHLAYGLEQGEEIILLTGEIGMGKTLALQCLMDRISPKFKTIIVSSTNLEFRELLKIALMELSVPFESKADLADLHMAFKRFLQTEFKSGNRILLIIDEAQNLSVTSIESLRLLLSLAAPGENNLNLVFAGQPGINQLIDLPELVQLKQRIRVHYHMEPLTWNEVKAYLNHRISMCGQTRELFNKDTIDIIFNRSHGVPRLVNHLASQALLAAFVDESNIVTIKHLHGIQAPTSTGDIPPASITSSDPSKDSKFVAKKKLNPLFLRLLLIAFVIGLVTFFSWPAISEFTSKNIEFFDHYKKQVFVGEMQQGEAPPLLSTEKTEPIPVASPSAPISEGSISDSPPDENEQGALASSFLEPSKHELHYAIHVASFQKEISAKRQEEFFEEIGYPSYHEAIDIENKIWYRVYIGNYSSKFQAKEIATILLDRKLINYSTIITK